MLPADTRWFMLKGRALSYYRNQKDESVSISMKTAVLKVAPGGEKLYLEVRSEPCLARASVRAKWHMKASHPIEARRWTRAIGKSIDWYNREREEEHVHMSGDSDASGLEAASGSLFRSGSSAVLRRSAGSHAEDSTGETDGDASLVMNHSGSDSHEDDAEEKNDESSDAMSTHRAPPYDSTFELQVNSTTAQVELTSQLLSDLAPSANAPPRAHEVNPAIRNLLAMVQGILHDYMVMCKAREVCWHAGSRRCGRNGSGRCSGRRAYARSSRGEGTRAGAARPLAQAREPLPRGERERDRDAEAAAAEPAAVLVGRARVGRAGAAVVLPRRAGVCVSRYHALQG
ncbi:hypothetical protein PLICRDRAFT_272996 [Plicaturopsis crispa FD-325 SS-3]|nr:hypothetical protein PLICRDRAFT_272996 [Plicaturopsis crispa FD-325 SS-3]